MLSDPSGSLPPVDPVMLRRTVDLLRDRYHDVAKAVDRMDPATVPVVEARTVVATLRSMMLDVTFDDSYSPGDVAELSEIFEHWRSHLDRAKE